MEIKEKLRLVFDTVYGHLLTQKETCITGENCLYRDPSSEKSCAVGCLIHDDLYDELMEGRGPGFPLVQGPLLESLRRDGIEFRGGMEKIELNGLVKSLQGIHDRRGPSTWEAGLKTLAKKCGL